MAWNRPSNDGGARSHYTPHIGQPKDALRSKAACGAIAGVVVVLGAACYFGVSSKPEGERDRPVRKPARIVDCHLAGKHTTDPLRRSPVHTKPKAEVDAPYGWCTNRAGQVIRRTRPAVVLKDRPSTSLFTNPVERQLDGIVNTPLGQNYYSEEVPEDFEEQFAYSLTNQIVISEYEPQEVAEKKQRVIDAKEHLVELKKQGKDLRKVILEEKQLLKKKFEDYLFFQKGVSDLRQKGASTEEIAEFALASKKMMDAQDIECPLTLDVNEANAMKRLDNLINQRPENEGIEEEDE